MEKYYVPFLGEAIAMEFFPERDPAQVKQAGELSLAVATRIQQVAQERFVNYFQQDIAYACMTRVSRQETDNGLP